MKRYFLMRFALWVLIFLFNLCSDFNLSLAVGIGSVLSLDGNEDEVRIEHAQSLVMTDALTIEAWIYPFGPGSGRSGGSGEIVVNKEGEYQLARFDDGSICFAVTRANLPTICQWGAGVFQNRYGRNWRSLGNI